MNTQPVIMVQISDRKWTLDALHCACVMARNTNAIIVLLEMIPVQYPSWLGSNLTDTSLDYDQQAALADYEATVEDYGVAFSSLMFQYDSFVEGIAQAAEYVHAQVLFAHISDSNIPLWTRFQKWSLHRQLTHQNCQWFQHPAYDPKGSGEIVEAIPELNTLAQHSR